MSLCQQRLKTAETLCCGTRSVGPHHTPLLPGALHALDVLEDLRVHVRVLEALDGVHVLGAVAAQLHGDLVVVVEPG